MSTLRLLPYLFSKRMGREILLLVQLVLMMLFSAAVLLPIDAFNQFDRGLHQSLPVDFSSTLLFNPSNALQLSAGSGDTTPQIAGSLAQRPDVAQVLQFGQDVASFPLSGQAVDPETGEVVEETGNFLLYSSAMAQTCQLSFSEGGWVTDGNGYCPIVVSASMAQILPVGTQVDLWLQSNQATVPCTVTGILDERCVIPVIQSYGSWPDLNVLGIRQSDFSQYKFIIAQENPAYFDNFTWKSNAIIIPADGADVQGLQEELAAELDTLGTVVPLAQVEDQAFEQVLSDNRFFLFAFCLLSLIAIFGYGGYLFLRVRQQREKFAVFSILGMTRGRMIGLNTLAGSLILLLAFGVSWLTAPWFLRQVLGIQQLQIGLTSIGYCGALLVFVLIFSSLAGFFQARRCTVIEQYRGGD